MLFDILLSVPLLSYIFFPTTGASASASVNLLFFYMTWSGLLLSHHPLEIHLSGLLVLRLLFWLLPSLLSLLFDLALPSLAAPLKHGGRASLPPRSPRLLARLLARAALNLFLWLALEAALGLLYALAFRKHIFRMTASLPLPWTVTTHCLFILASREVLHYHLHRRLLHASNGSRSPSGLLAARHAAYAHASSTRGAPFSLNVFTDHPLALFFHRFLPVFLPAALIRTHLLTYFLVTILTTVEETLAMSGYTFVPGLVMSGIATRTAIHYAAGGSSNYGPVGVMDWLHGTGEGRHVLDDVKKEAERHGAQKSSAQNVDEAKGALQHGLASLKKRVRSGKK